MTSTPVVLSDADRSVLDALTMNDINVLLFRWFDTNPGVMPTLLLIGHQEDRDIPYFNSGKPYFEQLEWIMHWRAGSRVLPFKYSTKPAVELVDKERHLELR